MYRICGAKANLYITFILSVFLPNSYNIYLILSFKLSICMGICDCGSTIWLKVYSLFLQLFNETIIYKFTGNVVSANMIGCVHALAQT